jgi:hypothetical protein
MSFDIYGQPLRSGHCEAHPQIRESWPCSHCMSAHDDQRAYERAMEEEYDRYCEEVLAAEYDAAMEREWRNDCLANARTVLIFCALVRGSSSRQGSRRDNS